MRPRRHAGAVPRGDVGPARIRRRATVRTRRPRMHRTRAPYTRRILARSG